MIAHDSLERLENEYGDVASWAMWAEPSERPARDEASSHHGRAMTKASYRSEIEALQDVLA